MTEPFVKTRRGGWFPFSQKNPCSCNRTNSGACWVSCGSFRELSEKKQNSMNTVWIHLFRSIIVLKVKVSSGGHEM